MIRMGLAEIFSLAVLKPLATGWPQRLWGISNLWLKQEH